MKALGALLLLVASPAWAQTEDALRMADGGQLEAARKGDADALAAMTLPSFIINNPMNDTGTAARMIARFRSGEVNLEKLDRTIERVAITGNVGVVMGHERVEHAPTSLEGRGVNRGSIIRRFTHVWLWEGGTWRWLARHANEAPQLQGSK